MINKKVLGLVDDYKVYLIGVISFQVLTLVVHIGIVTSLLNVLMGGSVTTLIVLLLVKMLMSFGQNRARFKLSVQVKTNLRSKLFDKMGEVVINKSEMAQLTGEAVEHIDLYMSQYLPQFFYSMIAPLILFLYIAQMHLGVALVLLLMVPLIPMSIVFVQKFAKRLLDKHYTQYLGMGVSFIEGVEGLSTLKMYDVDDVWQDKMDQEAEQFRKSTMRVLLMQLNSISVMDLLAYGGAGIAILIIAGAFAKGNINISEAMVMVFLSAEYFIPMRLLGSFFHVSMNGVSAADKMSDYLLQEKIEVEGVETVELDLRDINYSYGDKQVLYELDFNVKQGEFIGIAGMSGCGKSTLMNLLTRRINHDYKVYSKSYLLDHSVYLDYQSSLFSGTLRDNLKMGKHDATDTELQELLITLNLNGLDLDYVIDPNSSNLSGGQKQRIGLARCILKDPEIYFLDEVMSQVDSESEAMMMDIITKLHKAGKTIVMISHRYLNLETCDRILMMDQGHIIEEGSFKELLGLEGKFWDIYNMQEKGFEVI